MTHNKLTFRGLTLLLLGLVTLVGQAAIAGRMTPGLEAAFSNAAESERLPVLISFSRQPDLVSWNEFVPRGASLFTPERHAMLLDSLRNVSAASQAEVRTSLDILARNGMIERTEFLWIANLLRADVTRAGAELIANFETVNEIGLDESVELLAPTEVTPSTGKMLTAEAALVAMRARDAWSAGVFGDGTVVGVVGRPFVSSHPALNDRYVGAESLLASTYCDIASALMLGTAVGCDKQKGDTLGVAPNAKWRLLPLPCGNAPRLSDVLRALQSSQSESYDAIPDVILQAWQTGDSCASALPQAAWSAFANVEQLGSILIFAAGDHGDQGRGSVMLPAALSDQPQTFFAVGALNSDGNSVDPRSSRGPSPCDRKSIKPEITAIGVGVRSAHESDFVSARGSLLAAGYVAGAVALMRQVNPDLNASAAKTTLQLAARDLGVPGEDNEFGYGRLDINAAVEMSAAASETGVISGIVRYGGSHIVGARVYLISTVGSYTATTDLQGVFRFAQVPAEHRYALYVARFGYKDFAAPDSVSTSQRNDFAVSIDLERGLADDAEVDRGFIIGVPEDDATAGVWTRGIPVGSTEQGDPVQVNEDATAYGSYCFLTGNGAATGESAASHDVDGGRTTLRSPLFRLDNLADAKLRFKYAYSNDRGPQKGGDFFRVQISNDGGESWVNLIQTSVSSDGWQDASFKLEDFVAPTENMILQFVAEDFAPPSLVEAAVDEIFIEGRPDAPEPPKNLSLTPTDTGVQLTWNRSVGASSYKIYMAGEPGRVFAPENYFTTIADTALFVPFDQIPFDQFYFQVTAVK